MSSSTPKDFLYCHPSNSLSCSIAEELIREDPRQPQAFITQNKLLFTELVSELLNSWKMNGNISGEERPSCLISQASRCRVFDVWVSPSSPGYIRKNPRSPRSTLLLHLSPSPASSRETPWAVNSCKGTGTRDLGSCAQHQNKPTQATAPPHP